MYMVTAFVKKLDRAADRDIKIWLSLYFQCRGNGQRLTGRDVWNDCCCQWRPALSTKAIYDPFKVAVEICHTLLCFKFLQLIFVAHTTYVQKKINFALYRIFSVRRILCFSRKPKQIVGWVGNPSLRDQVLMQPVFTVPSWKGPMGS